MISYGQIIPNLKFSNPQLVNPALTGVNKNSNLNFSSTNMFGSFNQTYLDYSQYSTKLHGGIGIYTNNTFSSYAGNTSSNSLGFSYSYQNSINEKWHYSLGTSLEIGNSNWNYNGESNNNLNLGFKVGGLIYSKSLYASLSFSNLHNFKEPTFNFSNLRAEIGYKIKPIKKLDFSVTPSITFKLYNGPVSISGYGQVNTNIEAQYKKLHLGIGYGSGRPSASIGYDFNRFRLNYNMGNFGNIVDYPSYTTHQLSLKFKFKNRSNNSNRSSFDFNLF